MQYLPKNVFFSIALSLYLTLFAKYYFTLYSSRKFLAMPRRPEGEGKMEGVSALWCFVIHKNKIKAHATTGKASVKIPQRKASPHIHNIHQLAKSSALMICFGWPCSNGSDSCCSCSLCNQVLPGNVPQLLLQIELSHLHEASLSCQHKQNEGKTKNNTTEPGGQRKGAI